MGEPRLMLDLDGLADAIAERVVERLGAGAHVDQSRSPLGSRRHHAAVRRRLARGLPGAAIVGRRHLLSSEALAEELARAGHRDVSAPAATRDGARDDQALLARLGLRVVR